MLAAPGGGLQEEVFKYEFYSEIPGGKCPPLPPPNEALQIHNNIPNSKRLFNVRKRRNHRFDCVLIREHLFHVFVQHHLPSHTLSVVRVNIHRLEGLKLHLGENMCLHM